MGPFAASLRRFLTALLVMVACIATDRPAHSSDPKPDPKPEAGTDRCEDVRIEVSVEPLDSVPDAWTGILEGGFEISADVWNDCSGEISILPGEIVAYTSKLAPVVGEALQPRECLEGHLSVEGMARPGQAMRRTLLVERCLWKAESEETRSVRVDGGVLRTSAGVARYAPVEVELP